MSRIRFYMKKIMVKKLTGISTMKTALYEVLEDGEYAVIPELPKTFKKGNFEVLMVRHCTRYPKSNLKQTTLF